MMAALLAFDTSTERLHFGVSAAGAVRVREAEGGARASALLLPAVRGLLAEAGLALAGLDAIAFGRGPGAFTGLRTACAVAQGLAFGAGLPVLAIDTLMAVAEDAARLEAGDDVWVAMDARMNEIYAARYRRDGAAAPWRAVVAPALWTLDALHAAWHAEAPAAVAGSACAAFGERLDTRGARRVDDAVPRAAALLALAARAHAAGEATDAAQALPLYLRDKVALTIDEREAARAAKAAGGAAA